MKVLKDPTDKSHAIPDTKVPIATGGLRERELSVHPPITPLKKKKKKKMEGCRLEQQQEHFLPVVLGFTASVMAHNRWRMP
ncbi:hypothetical protein CDAR_88461 [Caerostris darwini]|uniref:Uncharacterized protein n=1 Tax=Caerostris darwini TaxID=1538125 RepID=A0AAV4Q1D0_9ARAC|nr:hypothetical protein CDAR_88461 [Caerostris darwini]